MLRLLAAVLLMTSSFAQEGHPLTGTWTGDWGPAAQRVHLTLVLTWDGKSVRGILNPGPNSAQIDNVQLNVTNWTVHFEADTKDPSGAALHISAEGKLEDIGSIHRKMEGIWRQGTTQANFRLTRD